MEYKQLGKSGLKISRTGFGCMSLQPTQHNVQYLVDEAISNGINYFDTADLYDKGLNEEIIGKAIKGQREKVVVATKVGNQWRPDDSGWDWNPRKSYILQAIDESLRRLQTDYIDLYQLHGGTIDDPIDETIEAFEILKQQGKIRYYGISSIRPNVIREYVRRSNISSVMMQFSLLDQRPLETCLPLLQNNNIGVLARGSVAGGLLVDKPAKAYLDHSIEEVLAAQQAVQQSSPGSRSAAHTAIQYVLHHAAVTAAVVGIRTQKQLQDALAASAFSLSAEEVQTLQQAIPAKFYKDHR
ncbi:aldo/keto reductase [Aridibaculum aurantiacum]|uniref:aldo/keto reductase n=1 Tax=Aridibaculum aurantiacum TaxID=2810307 RepID=UPI001A96E662|nr:aldo/keto reductase [Aridibaculum aurantiacum]